MSLISRFFGSDKVVDGLMSAADNIWETTEEKSKAKMMFLKLYEPFKIGQRIIATAVVVPFIFIHCTVVSFWLYSIMAVTNGELFDWRVSRLKEVAEMNNLTLGEPAVWIVAFYFLGGAGEGMIKAWSSKLAKK